MAATSPQPHGKYWVRPAALVSALAAAGFAYGLVVAGRVERLGQVPDALLLAWWTALFYLPPAIGLQLLLGLLERRRGRRRRPAVSEAVLYHQVRALGRWLLLVGVLGALAELLLTLTFRSGAPIATGVWHLVVLLGGSGLGCWLLAGPAARRLAHVTDRRTLAVNLVVWCLLLVAALWPGPGAEAAGPAAAVPRLERQGPGHPVLLVGLDGAGWQVLERLLADGELPGLQRLLPRAVRAEIDSPPPQVSPAVWTTIATGQPRERHGVEQYLLIRLPGVRPFAFEALAQDPWLLPFFSVGLGWYLAGVADGVPPGSRQVREPTLWQLASAAGLRVVVAGWPCTWPAQRVHGLLVSDGFGPGEFDVFIRRPRPLDRAVYPPEKLSWVQALEQPAQEQTLDNLRLLVPDLPALDELARYRPSSLVPPPALLLERVVAADRTRLRVAERAATELRPRLLALTLNGADMSLHGFWPQRWPADFGRATSEHPGWGRLVDGAHRLADSGIERLLALLGPDTVLVLVSDHGMRPSPENPVWPGWHDRRAVLLLAGPPVAGPGRLERVSYLDLAPTILHLLGLAVPRRLPGRVLVEAFDKQWLAAHPLLRQ